MVIIEYLFPSPYLTFIFLISLKKTTLRAAQQECSLLVKHHSTTNRKEDHKVYEHLFLFLFSEKHYKDSVLN